MKLYETAIMSIIYKKLNVFKTPLKWLCMFWSIMTSSDDSSHLPAGLSEIVISLV